MKTLQQAVEYTGLKASAELLHISSQRLSNWMDRGVPVEHCAAVEMALGVSRRDLRPEDWHLIWPEIAPACGPQPTTESAGQGVAHA